MGDWRYWRPISQQLQDNVLSDKDYAELADTFFNLGCDFHTVFFRWVAFNFAGNSDEAVVEAKCGSQHKWIYGTRLLKDVQSVFSENPIV